MVDEHFPAAALLSAIVDSTRSSLPLGVKRSGKLTTARYDPVLVNGTAVPAKMIVTVNFTTAK